MLNFWPKMEHKNNQSPTSIGNWLSLNYQLNPKESSNNLDIPISVCSNTFSEVNIPIDESANPFWRAGLNKSMLLAICPPITMRFG